MSRKLIIFTRYPEAGTTKTRLIPALGAEGAADLQRRMTERTIAAAKRLQEILNVELEVRFEGGESYLVKEWLGDDLTCFCQGGGDLGAKLAKAFDEAFVQAAEQVVVIGSDCPSLTEDILAGSFHRLTEYDLVLGPAADGGYYLAGLSRQATGIFVGQPWGSEDLLKSTLRTARELNLTYSLLEELTDVDRPEDLGDHTDPE